MGKLKPLKLMYGASDYCKFCNTWGNAAFPDDKCGNCGERGYLMPNPFPDRLVPYIELDATDLQKLIDLQANTAPPRKLAP